jgi:hypothetical protein
LGPGSTAPGPNQLSATVTGGSNPSTTFTAYVPPVLDVDSSQVMGNTTLASSVAPNVLANDAGINGTPLTITTTGASATVRSGTLTLNADGSFSYLPPAGNVLRDSVQYTVSDTHLSSNGWIKLRFVGKVWYVESGFAGTATGRDVSPFVSVAAAEAVAAVNDTILVRTGSGTTGGGTLKNGQTLRGQGHNAAFSTTLNLQSVTLLPTGTAPTVGALTLGSGNTLRGFTDNGGITGTNFGTLTVAELAINSTAQALSLNNGTLSGNFNQVSSAGGTNNVSLTSVTTPVAVQLGSLGNALSGATGDAFVVSGGTGSFSYPGSISQAANAALLRVSNGHSGALSFSASLSASNGTGVQFDNADGTYTFPDATLTLNGGDAGIDILNGSSGTFTFASSAAIINPTNEAIRIDASSPIFTYPGQITKTNGSTGITVSNNSSGTISFGSRLKTITSTGSNIAVNLATNGTATINSADSLVITSATGNGYNATGGGTVNVTGSANTVSSTGGTAVRISSTTVGASGIIWKSVSASGGPNGIYLSSTGATGGSFSVTGTGTAGSGGTISGTSGGDGTTGGNAVYLQSVSNIRLARMQINDHSNHGIYGSAVTSFSLDSSVVNGTNGNSLSGAFNEGAVHFEQLAGVVLLRQNTISGGALDNVYVANNTGTPVLNRMQLVNNTLGGTINQDGVRITATVGTLNVTATGNTFTYWEGDAFDMLAQGTATGDLIFQNNTAHNGNVSPVSGSTNIAVGGGAFTYNISNNSFRGAAGAAIAVDESGSLVGSVSGTINNNQIGASGIANSGSSQGSGIFVQQLGAGTSTTKISNNTIRQINGSQAILVQVSDASAGGGNGTLNVTAIGNNIQEEGATVATRTAMNFNIGSVAGDAHSACLQIGGSGSEENSITNFDTNRYRVQHRFNTTIRMPGYAGSAYDVSAVGSYLTPRNDIGGQALTNNSSSSGTGGGYQNTAGGGSCPQPST